MRVLTDTFFEAEKYFIYYNGEKQEINGNLIFPELKKMCEKSYFSPAFGVSINQYTLNELKKGLWLEMEYSESKEFAEMPYEKLLINFQPDFYGFNIIRYNSNGGYDGRCYYLNLNGSSTNFYNTLLKIANKKNN